LTTTVVVLIAALLLTATLAGYYALQYQQAESNSSRYLSELKAVQPTQETDFLFAFGNGTAVWDNVTVPTGSNAYVATVLAAHGVVNATWYAAPLNEHLVTGIDDLQNNQSESWFLWTYNSTASWQLPQVGADDLAATDGSVFAWTFCVFNPSTYVPSCTP
jgi:hypothetical protein